MTWWQIAFVESAGMLLVLVPIVMCVGWRLSNRED